MVAMMELIMVDEKDFFVVVKMVDHQDSGKAVQTDNKQETLLDVQQAALLGHLQVSLSVEMQDYNKVGSMAVLMA